MSVERRQHTRFSTSVPVGLRFPSGHPAEGWGRIIDISATGMRLESRFRLKVSGVVYVTFSLRDGARFENLRCRIIRSNYDDGYYVAGVAFDEVVDQETMKEVITTLAYEGGLMPL